MADIHYPASISTTAANPTPAPEQIGLPYWLAPRQDFGFEMNGAIGRSPKTPGLAPPKPRVQVGLAFPRTG